MIEKHTTVYRGGGDSPGTNLRFYTYRFYEKPIDYFRFYRVKVRLPFETNNLDVERSDLMANIVLKKAPFFVAGHNVMDWVRNQTIRGKATFVFQIDDSIEYILSSPECALFASFSDKGLGLMFKLAFGGR